MTSHARRVAVGFGLLGLSVCVIDCSGSIAADDATTDTPGSGTAGGASARTTSTNTGNRTAISGPGIPIITSSPTSTPATGTSASCSEIGHTCASAAECCSARCDFGLCLGATGLCSANGVACSASAECCSGRCEASASDGSSKLCVTSTVACMPGGGSCKADADCCSGVCGSNGICPVFAQCQTAGEPCTGHHECCTGVCADPGTGTTVCQYVGGCRPIGEVCDVAADCCSTLCQLDSTSGVKRCTKPAGCMWPGEVCWTGQAANCCPQGRDGGNSLCLPSVLGVRRCFSAGTPEACLPEGEPCAFGDECCGERCVPDMTGVLRCNSQCVPIGVALCTTNADCCEGICSQGTCVQSEQPCVPFGQSCSTDDDCCTGLCSQGKCTVDLVLL